MHSIGVATGFAILRLHQEQLEVIGGSQVLRDTCLTDSVLPEDRTDLPTQPIPALLVIIHNGTVKIAFQFLKGHRSCSCRCFSIMDAVTGIGQTPRVSLGHPAKESFDGSFGLSRQLHRLPLWQKEFSRSPIRFILCTASSLRSSPTDTIGGNTASRFTRLLIRCGRCLRPGPALLPLIPVSS